MGRFFAKSDAQAAFDLCLCRQVALDEGEAGGCQGSEARVHRKKVYGYWRRLDADAVLENVCVVVRPVWCAASIHSYGSWHPSLAAASEEQAREALLLPATCTAWLADEEVMERLALMTSDAVLQRVRGFGSMR